jgi:excisionase family DNA binding protein
LLDHPPGEEPKELGIDPQTIRLWIRSKKLKASKLGKQYLIKREHLDKFLEDSRTDTDENAGEK